ncbi:alpha-amylase family glycosyl hydrolase [Sphingomonas melonis]|uniref:Amylosucrase n=1 Tax=Sphingomonas melonis TaxID=152682 RepID=A0A7Y9FSA8_9SPHN|nr:alpha-amylase family glycosyl hydrolase [Sphingomonas melonis]NYD92263.1 amylosucrase [Sphingomonas melonis]
MHERSATCGCGEQIAPASASGRDERAAALIALAEPLYRDHPRWAEERIRLCAVLDEAAEARAYDLRTLDQDRAADPRWFGAADMVGYSFYVDRFARNLAGLQLRLGWLNRLGVRLLHPLPMTLPQSGDSDGGFAVADYRAVDPRLGTVDDVRAIARDLHERGMALAMDCVLNHCARDHAWAQAALAGDADKRDYFRIVASAEEVAAWEAGLDQVFPDTAPGNFTHEPALGGWVWTTFYPFQWDLDWSNPAVFREMLDVLLFWANVGVDVFRLDSAPYLWKRQGTASRNLPETHRIVAALRAGLDAVAPGVALLAEAIEQTREVLPYLEPEDGSRACQIAYHNGAMAALWTALATGNAAALVTVLDQTRLGRPDTAWLTYLRCHDDIIWTSLRGIVPDAVLRQCSAFFAGEGSYAQGRSFQARADAPVATVGMLASLLGGEGEDALARYRLMLGVLLALPGMPMLYMGDEIGLPNDEEGASALDARWLHRPAMDWTRAEAAANGAGPGAPFLQITRRLIGARAGCAAFAAAVPVRAEVTDDGVLVLDRGTVVVVANFAATARPIGERAAMVDMLTGAAAGETIPGYGLLWLTARD